MNRIPSLIAASVFALGLAACEKEPAVDQSGEPLAERSDGSRPLPPTGDPARSPGQMGALGNDETITAQVEARIAEDPTLGGNAIDVRTEGGVVTLSGTVQSSEQAQKLAELARSVEGVTEVDNKLTPSQAS